MNIFSKDVDPDPDVVHQFSLIRNSGIIDQGKIALLGHSIGHSSRTLHYLGYIYTTVLDPIGLIILLILLVLLTFTIQTSS